MAAGAYARLQPFFTWLQTTWADRDNKKRGKSKDGGIAVLNKSKWCSPAHITVKKRTHELRVSVYIIY